MSGGVNWLRNGGPTFGFDAKRRSYESEERGVEHDCAVRVERHVH